MEKLHKAIAAGDIQEVKQLTETGVDLNHVHGMLGTALSNAIASHQHDIARYLIEVGCDVNKPDYDGEPPLLLALRKEDLVLVKTLLDHPQCDINALDPVSKKTALCHAAESGYVDIVAQLIENPQCDVKKPDADNNTALHLAVLNQNHEVLRVLARIPELKIQWNVGGFMPIHIAAQQGDIETLNILYPSESGVTHRLMEPLFGKTDFESKTKNPTKDMNIRTRYSNDTALHYAVREGHREGHRLFAEILLEREVDINVQNNMYQTPLLISCGRRDLDMVPFLLEHKADPNKAGSLSNITDVISALLLQDRQIYPLGAAAYFNSLPLAEALVQNGADIGLKDDKGQTPLFIALVQNSPDTAMFLLCSAVENDVDISLHSQTNESLLHAVVRCTEKAYELSCFLIGLGCPMNARNRLGNLPLHEAIAHENVDVVKAIAEEGGSISELDRSGTSPLHLTALVGNVEIGRILLTHGADINELDECGHTPVFTALESEMVPFAQFLVRSGCNLSHEKYLYEDFDFEFETDEAEDLPMILLEEEETFEWFKRRARNPPLLLKLCIENIRTVFRSKPATFAKMSSLPLPAKLTERLFFRDPDAQDHNDDLEN